VIVVCRICSSSFVMLFNIKRWKMFLVNGKKGHVSLFFKELTVLVLR
jgi:hypothetical protein